MRSLFFIVLLGFVSTSFGWSKNDNANNWSGLDTNNIVNLYAKYDTLVYSKVMKLSDFEDCRAILKANDTSTARFKEDSIGVEWGYQTLTPCKNSSGVYDTCVDQIIVLDTLDSLAMVNFATSKGSTASDGVITRSTHIADTVRCAGYATQTKWFTPEWDVHIRFWVKGIGKNKKTVAVPCVIEFSRRNYVSVRDK